MSKQVALFKALIAQLQADKSNEDVANLLRRMCVGIANAAPVDELIELSMFLSEMGVRVGLDQIRQN